MSTSKQPVTLPERYGEGDTYLVLNFLPEDLLESAFENLKKEVQWNTMSHHGGEVPRLVAVEGTVEEDGTMPVYRHPADKSPPLLPWSPTVQRIRDAVSSYLNQPLNHALIQHYRHGGDYISEHSDKTIDVVRGSYIVNVSLGAQRTMTLRTKKDAARAQAKAAASPPAGGSAQAQNTTAAEGGKAERETQRVPLPHNSVFVMGLKTNEKWLHSIRHDKRPVVQKTPEELAFNGERISLTFRHIGTFLDKDETRIWGQGAKGKTREKAGQVIRSSKETGKMIRAFGLENSRSDFVWERAYGRGFDVLHFT